MMGKVAISGLERYGIYLTLRELYFELGRALAMRQRHQEAIAMFQQALREHETIPDESHILFHLAQSQDQDSDYQRAFRTYLEALLAAPEQSNTILPFVHNLLTARSTESHQEWLRNQWIPKVMSTDLTEVDKANIEFFLGRVYTYWEEYSKALAFLERAIRILAEDARVVEGFGEVLWKIGKFEQAQEALARALEMARQGMYRERVSAIKIKLAQVYIALGQYEAALSLFTEMQLENEQRNYEALLIHSECYLGVGQPAQAQAVLETAIKINASDIRAYLLQAQSLIGLGRDNDAVSSIDQALQYAPLNLQDAIRSTIFVRKDQRGIFHYFFAHSYYTLGMLPEALQEIEQALELGPIGKGDCPYTPELQLKAHILEAAGEKEKAAACYFEAGWRFYWAAKYGTAAEQFERATELRPDLSTAYWHWADTLLALSRIPVFPYVQKDYIKSSLEVWETAYKIKPPNANFAWAYLSRARICDRLAYLSDSTRWTFLPSTTQQDLQWEAISYVERAMLLGRQDLDAWALLIQFHRLLYNEANALHITHRVSNSGSESLDVLGEQAAILVSIGEFVEAEKVINKYLEKMEDNFGKCIQAQIALYEKKDYEKALKLLNEVLEGNPDYSDVRDLRASCYLLANHPSQAVEDYRWIWNKYSPNDRSQAHLYATAAYHIDKIEEAINIIQESFNDPSWEPGRAAFHLGLCYLAQQKLEEGEDLLRRGIEQMTNKRQLDDIQRDFLQIEKRSLGWPSMDRARLRNGLSRLENDIAKQWEKIQARRSPEEEMKQVIKKYPQHSEMGNWPWIGAQATLARIYNEEKRWVEAAETYQQLLPFFPEARIGLEQALDNVQSAKRRYHSC
jgi:tetratricopeptide (TPR) repeat protein